jgi:hypothetical protein
VTLTNRLTLYLWVRQTQNFQDLGFRWTARKHIMLSLRKALLELDIRYYPPVQKVEWIGADKVSTAASGVPTGPNPSAGPAMMAAARADPVAPTVAARPPDTFASP